MTEEKNQRTRKQNMQMGPRRIKGTKSKKTTAQSSMADGRPRRGGKNQPDRKKRVLTGSEKTTAGPVPSRGRPQTQPRKRGKKKWKQLNQVGGGKDHNWAKKTPMDTPNRFKENKWATAQPGARG